MKSPLPYIGGKARVAARLAELLPKHKTYAEPFCGGCWVLFSKTPSRVEAVNDADAELVNLLRCFRHHPEELHRTLSDFVIAREEYNRLRSLQVRYLTDIQRAARFFFLLRLGWYGRPNGGAAFCSSPSPIPLKMEELEFRLQEVKDRLSSVWIEHMDFAPFIERFDRADTVFYCDPPYEGSEKFYSPVFTLEDNERLAATLSAIEGKFLLTTRDTMNMRRMFSDFNISTYGAIWTTRKKQSNRVNELVISNFDLSTTTPLASSEESHD